MVMDYTKIPYFASFRQAGTVIVRLKMDVTDTCCSRPTSPQSYPGPVHRTTDCEQCSRTRSYSRNSDCDSDLVDRCRPYRSSIARSRYVNVCAAVCLVLLVGGLSPQSTAAPHKRIMDRQRRSTPGENSHWGNPCDVASGVETKTSDYSPIFAKRLATQARSALGSTSKYKDKFVKLLSYNTTYDVLLKDLSGSDWLRQFKWLEDKIKEGLPKDNLAYQQMPNDYLVSIINDNSMIQSMNKGLKMVVAGLYYIGKEGLNDNIASDASLKLNITQSMHDVRAVLCLFNELMLSRDIKILPLLDEEVPDMKNDIVTATLVYRDTLHYLEYLAQVFQKMYEVDSMKN